MSMTERKEAEARERIRDFLSDLYGDEEILIVRNTTNGVVSVGFGDMGDKGGKAIDRSKLPIVLTDEFPRDLWIKSADFRRAVAKGWLVPVKREEYDKEMHDNSARLARLEQLAQQDAQKAAPKTRAANIFSDDPDGEPMVIDEDSSELTPASKDKRTREFMEYEGLEARVASDGPSANTPVGVDFIGGNISSRAISFCEEIKRGTLTSNDALKWLDQEERVLTKDDLSHIIANAEFDSVQSLARQLLIEKKGNR